MAGLKTGAEIDRPPARDIVRYFDVAYLATVKICGDNIVGVDIPGTLLAMSCIQMTAPHTVLHVVNHPQRSGGQSSAARRPL